MRRGLIGLCLGSMVIALAGVPATASTMPRIGSGDATCVLAPKADCTDVIDKWGVDFHGDLSGAKFVRARLHGADLRGANLDRADLRGVVLRHAQLQDARLRDANLGPARTLTSPTRTRMRTPGLLAPSGNSAPCGQQCQGADLSGANLVGANLTGANLQGANLTGANLTAANLEDAVLTSANLTGATLTSAQLSHTNLSETNFMGAIGSPGAASNAMWFETVCPNGAVTNTGCW